MSAFQPANIYWDLYREWSKQIDGVSRVALRSSYGARFTDNNFYQYRRDAINAGIDQLLIYHYGYPEYNSAIAEADFQYNVVGPIRPQDILILDFEEDNNFSTPEWAITWLVQQKLNYGGKVPGIYSYPDFIARRLQNPELANYPLWYADWTFDPNSRPLPPSPWSRYFALQYTDNATNIPGINATIDVDVFIGGNMVPNGWTDDGIILTAPNGVIMAQGFRQYVLSQPVWDPNNVPLRAEYGANPAILHRPDLGGGTRQEMREGLLWWTNASGVVYEGQIGLELVSLYDALAKQSVPALIQSDIQAVKADVDKLVADLQSA